MAWEIRFSNSRQRPYFYDSATQESRWDPPEGLTDVDILALPGADILSQSPPQTGDPNDPRTANDASKPTSVQASHLLIKHSGSRRPSSWKETNITRSKDEAITTLQGFQAQLQADPAQLPAKFAEIASTESDCSSHSHGGDLGVFKKGQMQKPFEDAAFGLQVGQMSDIISTDSGVHLILRTA